MPGESAQLKDLAVRKQLLVAESEIHRAALRSDWQSLCEEAGRLTEEMRAFGSMASGGAKLVASGIALKDLFMGRSKPGHSWTTILMKGASAGLSLWKVFRAKDR